MQEQIVEAPTDPTPVQDWRTDDPEKCQTIEVGDFVRSFDWEFDKSSYVDGIVRRVGVMMEGCPRYEVRALRRVLSGKAVSLKHIPMADYYPPVNGTPHLFGGFCNGVRKLGRAP